jgi:hypothetical protein
MTTGLYNTLGYNFDDPNGDVNTLSDNTISHLNTMPEMIKSWQVADIINNDVGGYYQNPVANTVQVMRNTVNLITSTCTSANGLQGSTSTITDIFNTIGNNTLANTCLSYIEHTDRISGVVAYAPSQDVNLAIDQYVVKPYYKTAIAVGRLVMYLTNQTDAITNTSPIMGNFTSLFVGPQLSDSANTISIYYNLISSSITYSSDVNGNTIATSSLTLPQVNTINDGIANTIIFLTTRQTHDENFFTNSNSLVTKYQAVNQFGQIGETQNYLINNFIGSPKLLSRINT